MARGFASKLKNKGYILSHIANVRSFPLESFRPRGTVRRCYATVSHWKTMVFGGRNFLKKPAWERDSNRPGTILSKRQPYKQESEITSINAELKEKPRFSIVLTDSQK